MKTKDPQRLPPLDLLAAFESAARHLSFTKAAAERFLTQSAVSRQIAALESELGVPLFRRRHRALDLTDEGRRLADTVRTALGDLRAVVGEIRTPHRREVLALTTTPGFASLWLIPRLSSFVAAHPGVDVRIDASLVKRHLAVEGFDVAVRYGRVGATEGRPLFEESIQPVCAPSLVKRGANKLARPEDLRAHTLLQIVNPPDASFPLEWSSWLQGVGLPQLEPAATLSFSSYDDAIRAALDGQGVVLGRRPLVDALLRQRKLVAPFKQEQASARGYFIVVDEHAQRKASARALVQWLIDEAAAK